MIRTRIAPSPTGSLHIGTARTALFNYLFAKKNNGVFVLRIEDTDLERSDKKFEAEIFDSLRWLGIRPNEGPEEEGPFGPYRQSERLDTYAGYLQKMLDDRSAFYCFHTEQELEAERERLLTEKLSPVHHCSYRDLSLAEATKMLPIQPEHIIRFRTPQERTIAFSDIIRGEIKFSSGLLGDFSLAKNLRTPLYNFAVVIDDFTMKISHVLRGEDHIPNTPKQILIAESLGFSLPQYGHIPLILAEDRSKLSKRHGATAIADFRSAGYLPEALVNFMALLGWNPGTEQEIFSLSELEHAFSLEHIQKSGAVFNTEKLDWMNGEYIRQKPLSELAELTKPFLQNSGLLENQNSKFPITDDYIAHVISLEQPRMKKLSEIGEKTDYFFRESHYDKELLRWKEMSNTDICDALDFSEKIVSDFPADISKEEIEKNFLNAIGAGDKGKILWPLRVALSGKKASPGPFDILAVLGRNRALERIQSAKTLLRQ